jgi:hypothetical protein
MSIWTKEFDIFGKRKEKPIVVPEKKLTLLEKIKAEHPSISPELELLIILLIKEREEIESELSRIRRWAKIPSRGCRGPF